MRSASPDRGLRADGVHRRDLGQPGGGSAGGNGRAARARHRGRAWPTTARSSPGARTSSRATSRTRSSPRPTVDPDGWLHTGDVGAWEDGHLKILDRKKDIIITAGGKNITPAYIENKLKFSGYIQDAIVVGDGRRYLVALILIDEDTVTKFAQDQRIPFTTFQDLTQNPAIVRLIESEVERVNRTLSQVESVKKFALLPRRFYAEEGDVTPTMKVKRRALEERYGDLIRGLYRE